MFITEQNIDESDSASEDSRDLPDSSSIHSGGHHSSNSASNHSVYKNYLNKFSKARPTIRSFSNKFKI
jgi:hypothetical protein